MATTTQDATEAGNEGVITVEWLGPKHLRVTYPEWIARTKSSTAPAPRGGEPNYDLHVEYVVKP
jgi:hypothetical protein